MGTNERKYTWFLSTYASVEEFQPLLNVARHWAYAIHDKDTRLDENGNRVPKEKHTHIIVVFEQNVSLEWCRKKVNSTQNTLGQSPRYNESIRGMWKYLIHDGENPLESYQYDESERICDDKEYWAKRAKDDLMQMVAQESFYEDLLSDDFSVREMGRKYGRDFMKNMKWYLAFREECISETKIARPRVFDDLLNACYQINITPDEIMRVLFDYYDTRVNQLPIIGNNPT